MPKSLRVHELAKQLGMTNAEIADLCGKLGIGVKGPSSTLIEAQADRVRARAEREGLVREVQPEEAAPKKKAAPRKATAKKSDDAAADAGEPTAPTAPTAQTAPAATPTPAPTARPASPQPARPAPISAPAPRPAPPAQSPRPAAAAPAPAARPATPAPARPATPPTARPAAPAPARPATPPPGGRQIPPPPSGRPIPPPPGGPRPAGRPIPPPPGGPRPSGGRPPMGGPRPGGMRPGNTMRTGRIPLSRLGRGPGQGPRPGGAGRPGDRPPMGGRGTGLGRSGPGGRGPGQRGPGNRRNARKKSRQTRRREMEEMLPAAPTSYTPSSAPVPEGTVIIERGVSAQEFAPKLNRTAADVVRFLLEHGEMVTATMTLADEQMELFALEVGAEILLVDPGQQEELELQALFDDSDDEDEAQMAPRPPIITVMGHVDHGKTTLLDKIRRTDVVAGEAGGITQHIGAYQVVHGDKPVTFIDTPGHAAFTKMRARGAQITDIVVLVVAADDGVMPQTIEAINHARAAEVPIVVALNKIDKSNADPQRVLAGLAEQQLTPESWGGDTIVVEMSAQQGLGIDDLLEQLTVVAELEDLQANPTGRAKGVVVEAQLETGRGPVATVLIDKGTLEVGDPIVAGAAWGKVRALINDKGEQIKSAGPSTPVQILGLSAVPAAGDEFRVAPDERTARTVAEAREQRFRALNQRGDARVQRGVKLEDIFTQIQAGEVATLNVLIKADVHGSLEAVTESLRKLEREDVRCAFVHRAVGAITENDVSLAATTNATIIGFNIRPDRRIRELAEAEKVEIRTYEIIYKLLEDVEKAMKGMLKPEFVEVVTGEAEVRELFRVPKIGAIAGCSVRSGTVTRGSKVRFLRDGAIIWKGSISSLRRFKDDVKEVREGFECGIGLSDFQDLKQGDIIETYDLKEVERE
ncbi:MAG: translation initiation factor IF-2 [Acidimicrobiia bacterium]